MITYIKGNLFDNNATAWVNTVNTVGVMGKGIALQFKFAFPHNFEIYKRACRDGELAIGQLLAVWDSNLLYGERLIINLPTKTHWRLPSEYAYVEKGLAALKELIDTRQLTDLAMPAPGCGNGGLDRQVVKCMIERHLAATDCAIKVYKLEI